MAKSIAFDIFVEEKMQKSHLDKLFYDNYLSSFINRKAEDLISGRYRMTVEFEVDRNCISPIISIPYLKKVELDDEDSEPWGPTDMLKFIDKHWDFLVNNDYHDVFNTKEEIEKVLKEVLKRAEE